jgi:hypothetical protein
MVPLAYRLWDLLRAQGLQCACQLLSAFGAIASAGVTQPQWARLWWDIGAGNQAHCPALRESHYMDFNALVT